MSSSRFDNLLRQLILGAMSAVLILVSASAWAAATPAPWYQDADCKAAYKEVMSLEVDRIESAIDTLKSRRSLAAKVCSYWMQLPRSTAELILNGKSNIRPEVREKRLKLLNRMAMRFGRQHPELRDLAIEARMGRVRLLLETGSKTEALDEARRVKKMLASRQDAPATPSRTYVQGTIDLLVGEAAWPIRTLLSMAGVKGDGKRGRKALEALAAQDTVYRAEALSVLYHFARQNEGSKHARTLRYGKALTDLYPENPQFAFDHAQDLVVSGQAAAGLARIEPAYQRLLQVPQLWSSRIRKRVQWITAKSAFDCGRRDLAHTAHARASREGYGGYTKELAGLSDAMTP